MIIQTGDLRPRLQMRRVQQPTELEVSGGLPGTYHLQQSTQAGSRPWTNIAVFDHTGSDNVITNAFQTNSPAAYYRTVRQ